MRFNLDQIYIAVEGVPGCGKNLLAKKISKWLNAKFIEDVYYANPFLKDFYNNPETQALPLQLYYLTKRFQQQTDLPYGDLLQQNLVTNYIFNKDQIYASYNLDDRNLSLYNQILKVMNPQIKLPDLVIYLHSPNAGLLYKNIKKRNRAVEKDINEEYIEGLNKGYHYFFERFRDCPLLIINIEGLDLENNEHINTIFKEIEEGVDESKYLKI
jgi:deoxyguanosine kinase